jgi:hypothetical protein
MLIFDRFKVLVRLFLFLYLNFSLVFNSKVYSWTNSFEMDENLNEGEFSDDVMKTNAHDISKTNNNIGTNDYQNISPDFSEGDNDFESNLDFPQDPNIDPYYDETDPLYQDNSNFSYEEDQNNFNDTEGSGAYIENPQENSSNFQMENDIVDEEFDNELSFVE